MSFHPPIEQLVRRTDTPFQLGFAVEAKTRFRAREGVAFAASRRGLHVLARDEDALAAPVNRLRDVYGARLEVAPPAVRLIEGVQVREPIMHVRICVRTHHVEAVRRALLARGALPTEQHARSRHAVLRYEAPLARLLGLPAELTRLTEGSAQYWIALSHYALVTGDPGGRAA